MENYLPQIARLYNEATRKLPILKYSWVIVGAASIFAIIGYLKLQNFRVFYFTIIVIILSFICFLFSLFLNEKDRIIRAFKYVLVFSITITSCVAILGFGSFIIWTKPAFYKRWFPDLTSNNDSTKQVVHRNDTTTRKESAKKRENIIVEKPRVIILSIQLRSETGGYSKLFLGHKQLSVLPESTPYNPRIKIENNNEHSIILILTKNGDTCTAGLPLKINSSISRIIPNCSLND